MVQGERTTHKNSSDSIMERNKDSKRAGFNSMQKNQNASKDSEKKSQDNKNGAWGSTFKSRDHFVNLHMCQMLKYVLYMLFNNILVVDIY